jgi:hypothetical protein
MPLKSEFMARGMAAGAAGLVGQDPAATTLTATGSTQGGALALASNFAIFGTVAGSTGAILGERGIYIIVNGGGSPLTVYPQVGGNINGGTLNAGFSVTNGKSAIFISNGLTWGAILSA